MLHNQLTRNQVMNLRELRHGYYITEKASSFFGGGTTDPQFSFLSFGVSDWLEKLYKATIIAQKWSNSALSVSHAYLLKYKFH